MIDTEKGLTGFAYAAHCGEQLLGRCEISGLRFVGVVPKPVYVGNQTVAAAEQSATLGGMFKPGVSLNPRCYRVSDLDQPAFHAVDSITAQST